MYTIFDAFQKNLAFPPKTLLTAFSKHMLCNTAPDLPQSPTEAHAPTQDPEDLCIGLPPSNDPYREPLQERSFEGIDPVSSLTMMTSRDGVWKMGTYSVSRKMFPSQVTQLNVAETGQSQTEAWAECIRCTSNCLHPPKSQMRVDLVGLCKSSPNVTDVSRPGGRTQTSRITDGMVPVRYLFPLLIFLMYKPPPPVCARSRLPALSMLLSLIALYTTQIA